MADDDSTRRTDLEDSPSVRGLTPGTRVFGRYALEAQLASGGMGVIWRARDAELGESVALEFLPGVVARDDGAIAEFKDEFSRAGRLTHPNIVCLHRFEREGATAAVTMEWVNGTTLSQLRLQQPGKVFDVETLGPLVAQLCAALDYAHSQAKIVHRDLRLTNVLVTAEGVLKVKDFGIARCLHDLHARLTGRAENTGSTLLSMSPQQLRGDDPAASDDIYALGAMLYELFAGRAPFYTGDVAWQIREMMPKSVNSRLTASGLSPLPAGWDETILACLAKEQEGRPRSAGAVALRLNLGAVNAQETPAPPAAQKPASDSLPCEFTVTVDPADAGAKVWLGPASGVDVRDGRVVVEGLPDGEHELIVQAEGYQLFTTRVAVVDGRGSAEARLTPVKGAIAITARPGTSVTAVDSRGRQIVLGTVPAGGALANDTLLTVGGYRLKFAHPDCTPVELPEIELVIGRTIRVAPAQAPLPGELRVFSVPTGAEVRVGGTVSGSTPATIRNQPSGQSLRVEVFQHGYRRTQQEVTLKPREVRTVNFGLLTVESGGIELRLQNADVAWTSVAVSVDGKPLEPGQLSSAISSAVPNRSFVAEGLEVGSRTVEVTHPDHEAWRQVVDVRDHENTPVEVALVPLPGTVACETTPAGARVVINGVDQHDATFVDSQTEAECLTPLRGMLHPGTYTLRFELKEYQPAIRTVTVVPNQTVDVSAELEKLIVAEEGRGWTVPDLGLEMVYIQPGVFTMGSAGGGADEKPPTRITLGRGYWLGKTEVTQGQWETLMGATVTQQRDKANREWALRGEGRDYPIYYVDWDEAMEFCRKLTERERASGRLPAGLQYALPTEAQWEYACRAGTTDNYAGSLDAMAWYGGDKGGQTHPVAQKQANAWGLFDMHGNVREWCWDWYQDHLPGGNVADPAGPSSGSTRVTRGGSWISPAKGCRSAARFGSLPAVRQGSLGFRVALAQARHDDAAKAHGGRKSENQPLPVRPPGPAESASNEADAERETRAGSPRAGDHGMFRGGAELQPESPTRRDDEPVIPARATLSYSLPVEKSNRRDVTIILVAVLGLAAAGWWFFGSNSAGPAKGGAVESGAAATAAHARESGREQPRMEPVAGGPDVGHEISGIPTASAQQPKAVSSSTPPSVNAADERTRQSAASAGSQDLRGSQVGHPWTVPDLNLELAYIRPGAFTIGSPDSEKGRYKNESPTTRVTLTKGYWLGKTEVTQGQWTLLMAGNPSSIKGADRPVERVSWGDAMEFCRRLTERERAAGRLPDGYAYTLPTEAQWEYACRAGTTGPYAESENLDDTGWYSQNSGNAPHPVAQKQPNAWGLFDMHGNVWEWCRDWYGGYPGGSVTDPTGPASGTFRVDRGGSYSVPGRYCRSAFRRRIDPGDRDNNLGFRIALAPLR